MRLTIIGASASYAGPGQACSGYLLEAEGTHVLLDCGNGVLANLQKVLDPRELDAVFITHSHPDHFVDLFAMQALIRYDPAGPLRPIPLYVPDALIERMSHLLSARGAAELSEAFEPYFMRDGEGIAVNDLVFTPRCVEHTDPTFALRVEQQGKVFAYSADSKPGTWIEEVLAGADLGLVEATMAQTYEGLAPHMTATQAAEAARAAGVGRLILTHIWPTNDREQTLREGARAFGREVSLANEFDTYDI